MYPPASRERTRPRPAGVGRNLQNPHSPRAGTHAGTDRASDDAEDGREHHQGERQQAARDGDGRLLRRACAAVAAQEALEAAQGERKPPRGRGDRGRGAQKRDHRGDPGDPEGGGHQV